MTTTPTAVLFLDIDNFKNINDKFGHLFGDFHLRRVAQAIAEVDPARAVGGRYGGEEFVVAYRDATLEDGCDLARRIQQALRADLFDLVPPTITVGVALLQPGGSLDDAVAAADQAMLRGKAEGRNTVRCAR